MHDMMVAPRTNAGDPTGALLAATYAAYALFTSELVMSGHTFLVCPETKLLLDSYPSKVVYDGGGVLGSVGKTRKFQT